MAGAVVMRDVIQLCRVDVGKQRLELPRLGDAQSMAPISAEAICPW